MIRNFKTTDMNDVLDIWLQASIKSHSFVGNNFWESKIDDMRDIYIPNSDTYVFTDNGIIKGFFSIKEDILAAMFVSPEFQGNGIGQQLMERAKSLRKNLNLSVYRENIKSIQFYQKCGFKIKEENVDKHTGHVEFLMEFNS